MAVLKIRDKDARVRACAWQLFKEVITSSKIKEHSMDGLSFPMIGSLLRSGLSEPNSSECYKIAVSICILIALMEMIMYNYLVLFDCLVMHILQFCNSSFT